MTTESHTLNDGQELAGVSGYISERHQGIIASGSEPNFIVLDAGHRYELFMLDGVHQQELRFVKRFDLGRPWRFPGNMNGHPGTTLQGVLRVLIDRVIYLQKQIWAIDNVLLLFLLRFSLWCLEFRAARRHGRIYWHGITFASTAPMCPKCGHTVCEHTGAAAPAAQKYNAEVSGARPPLANHNENVRTGERSLD